MQHPNTSLAYSARNLLVAQIKNFDVHDRTSLIDICVANSPVTTRHFNDEFKVGWIRLVLCLLL